MRLHEAPEGHARTAAVEAAFEAVPQHDARSLAERIAQSDDQFVRFLKAYFRRELPAGLAVLERKLGPGRATGAVRRASGRHTDGTDARSASALTLARAIEKPGRQPPAGPEVQPLGDRTYRALLIKGFIEEPPPHERARLNRGRTTFSAYPVGVWFLALRQARRSPRLERRIITRVHQEMSLLTSNNSRRERLRRASAVYGATTDLMVAEMSSAITNAFNMIVLEKRAGDRAAWERIRRSWNLSGLEILAFMNGEIEARDAHVLADLRSLSDRSVGTVLAVMVGSVTVPLVVGAVPVVANAANIFVAAHWLSHGELMLLSAEIAVGAVITLLETGSVSLDPLDLIYLSAAWRGGGSHGRPRRGGLHIIGRRIKDASGKLRVRIERVFRWGPATKASPARPPRPPAPKSEPRATRTGTTKGATGGRGTSVPEEFREISRIVRANRDLFRYMKRRFGLAPRQVLNLSSVVNRRWRADSPDPLVRGLFDAWNRVLAREGQPASSGSKAVRAKFDSIRTKFWKAIRDEAEFSEIKTMFERRGFQFPTGRSGGAPFMLLGRGKRSLPSKISGKTTDRITLSVDHIVELKKDWRRGLRADNFRLETLKANTVLNNQLERRHERLGEQVAAKDLYRFLGGQGQSDPDLARFEMALEKTFETE